MHSDASDDGSDCDGEPSQYFGVVRVERSVTTVSVGSLWECYEMSCTFSVWMVLLCSAIVWDVWKHYELWLTQRRLALPVCLIGSWCHSRMWSVSESERLVCTAKLLIRQQVVQVILLDLYSCTVADVANSFVHAFDFMLLLVELIVSLGICCDPVMKMFCIL